MTTPKPKRHKLRKRVGRYSWWEREIVVEHDPQWIVISVADDFRMLLGCAERDCIETIIR